MKVSDQEVSWVVTKILEEWKKQDLAGFLRQDEEKLRLQLIGTFLAELRVEDDLNKEVDAILSKYEKQFESGALDRRKMFQMVRAQLAKERKLVL